MSRPLWRRAPQNGCTARWQVERWKPHWLLPWLGEWVREAGHLSAEQADLYAAHQMKPPHYYGGEASE